MEDLINSLGMNNIIYILSGLLIIVLIGFVILLGKVISLNKRYKKFIVKLGDGKDLQEDLENYMYRVERVERQNAEILGQIIGLDKDLEGCIQKVGILRYSAFQDTGSDLSFTLALLDEHDNGVVLNGIYSREMSNIYAKPVEGGKSKYTLSEEEQEAIKRAIETDQKRRIK